MNLILKVKQHIESESLSNVKDFTNIGVVTTSQAHQAGAFLCIIMVSSSFIHNVCIHPA